MGVALYSGGVSPTKTDLAPLSRNSSRRSSRGFTLRGRCLSISSKSEISKGELQVPESFVRSCFSQQASGKWEFKVPEDPAAKESYILPIGFITTGFVRGSKKPVTVDLCKAVCLAHLREEQWKAVGVRKRRKVRNLRSTAYRLALASIVLEQWEDDVECM
ncbi:hypothetical protein HAX54_040758 [Datura stramonium]|uniref:Uncharacterized protein n=1 Tax=Datura stramonium TaxID=4076 RepID=A0ABS8RNE7_DATST|nr:hypothetical protein [Datura stramonium]